MATALLADRLSPRVRAPERDAARLVGSPSFLLPSFRFQSRGEASWTLEVFYEPHRFPLGRPFARSLPLAAGTYRLTLDVSDPLGGTPPGLIATDRRTRVGQACLLRIAGPGAKSIAATFTVGAASDVDLSLVGGEPLAIRQARLRVSR